MSQHLLSPCHCCIITSWADWHCIREAISGYQVPKEPAVCGTHSGTMCCLPQESHTFGSCLRVAPGSLHVSAPPSSRWLKPTSVAGLHDCKGWLPLATGALWLFVSKHLLREKNHTLIKQQFAPFILAVPTFDACPVGHDEEGRGVS